MPLDTATPSLPDWQAETPSRQGSGFSVKGLTRGPVSASSPRPDEDSIMSPSELAAPLPLSPAPSLVVDDSPGFQPADTRLNPPSDTVSPPPPSPCQEPLVPLDSATPLSSRLSG